MKKILVTGANGQLGQAFYEIAPAYHDLHFIWVSKEELDITSKKDIGVLNAYNFMDDINGITGFYSLVILITLYYINLLCI